MQSSSSCYLSRLDHLRFVAALLVLIWHTAHQYVPTYYVPSFWPASVLKQGHTGVSLFMVLSGFIFLSLNRGKEVAYGEFLRNRALRIAPLFTVWLSLSVYTHGLAVSPKVFYALLGLCSPMEMPGVGWTILVEVQFYLLFPFLLRKYNQNGLWPLVGLLATAMAFRWCAWFTQGTVHNLAYWTLFGRIDQFLLGMIFCELYHRHPRVFRSTALFAAVLAVWLVLAHRFARLGGFYHWQGHPSEAPIWIVLTTVEGVVYGVLTACWLASPLRLSAWVDRGLAWMGKLSYSFYLNHGIVIAVAVRLAVNWQWEITSFREALLFTFALVLPLVTALSALTYYTIELPFLSLRRSYQLAPPAPAAPPRASRAA